MHSLRINIDKPFQPRFPFMGGEGSQQVDAELSLGVENREVEAEKLLVRRTIMLLSLFCHTETKTIVTITKHIKISLALL